MFIKFIKYLDCIFYCQDLIYAYCYMTVRHFNLRRLIIVYTLSQSILLASFMITKFNTAS